MAKSLLADPGMELEVERRAQVLRACFKVIATLRAKDVRS